ncbi:MAG: glycosyltransferase family 2 protein [Erysipelothrix sp.]
MFTKNQLGEATLSDKFSIVLLMFIPLLSDWKISAINIGDMITLVVTLYATVKLINMKKLKMVLFRKTLIIPILIVICNIFIHILLSSNFNLNTGIFYFLKIGLYVVFVNVIFSYISINNLQAVTFKYLVNTAVVVGVIGMILSLMILLNNKFPTEFFWSFTRSDRASYIFRGTSIVRMRSFFSEPSYLGLYFNLVLSIYLFTKFKVKQSLKPAILLSVFVMFTFAFSALATLALIWGTYLFFVNKLIYKNKRILIVLSLSLLIVIFLLRNQLYETLVRRVIAILSGADTSTINRLIGSWSYINLDNIVMGNGVGMTPPIWNNLAYILSDFGLLAFIPFMFYLYKNCKKNLILTFMFVVFSFQRGGYLNCYYWFSFLIIVIFSRCDFSSNSGKSFNFSSEDLTVMVSTMQLYDGIKLVDDMRVTSKIVICNQKPLKQIQNSNNSLNNIRIYTTDEIGSSRSRNTLLNKLNTKLTVIADDDVVYNDNYDYLISSAFSNHPYADVILFNFDNMGSRFVIDEPILINKLNFTKFGSVRIAFKTQSILTKGISFPISFGPGSVYLSGEDTLFLKQCLDNNLTIIALPIQIGSLSENRESTWFSGYDENYYFNKGALYAAIGYWYKDLNILQFALRKFKLSEGEFSFFEAYQIMNEGAKSYMSDNDKNENTELISIVIPMFNSEKSIKKTITSILDQSYTNYEVILVNDGSTDNTSEVIDELIGNNHKFKVVDKQNGGVSSARNVGMSFTTGDYLLFLDADDSVDSCYLQDISDGITANPDLVYCGYKTISNLKIINETVYDITDNLLKKYLISSFHVQTACFCIKRNILISNNVKFNENISWGEDILFFSEVLSLSSSINSIPKANVNYTQDYADKTKLSHFNISQIDDDVFYLKLLLDKQFIIEDNIYRDILENYRIPAQIVNKLLKCIREEGNPVDVALYYDKYFGIIARPLSRYAGLRSIKLELNKRKLRKLVKNENQR